MNTDSHIDLIAIIGPTAVGKTALGAKLAYEFNGEVISADSRQVYKGLDIGTGKDLSDYTINGTTIHYHLIDIADPSEEYNLFRFTEDFYNSYEMIKRKNKVPFLIGGTGLYLSAILQSYKLNKQDEDEDYRSELISMTDEQLRKILLSYKPAQHNTTDLFDRERTIKAIMIAKAEDTASNAHHINSLIIGVNPGREIVKSRITERLKHRLKNGMIEEVKKLINSGVTYERLDLLGLEYRYIGLYLRSKLNYNDMFQKLNSSIHDFAKRQMTWFRKMQREGVNIHWLDKPDIDAARELIRKSNTI